MHFVHLRGMLIDAMHTAPFQAPWKQLLVQHDGDGWMSSSACHGACHGSKCTVCYFSVVQRANCSPNPRNGSHSLRRSDRNRTPATRTCPNYQPLFVEGKVYTMCWDRKVSRTANTSASAYQTTQSHGQNRRHAKHRPSNCTAPSFKSTIWNKRPGRQRPVHPHAASSRRRPLRPPPSGCVRTACPPHPPGCP